MFIGTVPTFEILSRFLRGDATTTTTTDHGRCQQPCVTMRQARKLLDRFAISIRSEIEIS